MVCLERLHGTKMTLKGGLTFESYSKSDNETKGAGASLPCDLHRAVLALHTVMLRLNTQNSNALD